MRHLRQHLVLGLLAASVFWAVAVGQAGEPRKTQNVIFVMTDGLRWQEMFCGADASLLNGSNHEKYNIARVKGQYCRETAEASREALLPFVWQVVAKQGQVYGNRGKQSQAQLANDLKFSYPGYSETLCGFVEPRIDRNDYGPNPNVTVLEWLHQKPAYRGKVAAFGAWDVFDAIFNRARCGFCVNAGYTPLTEGAGTPAIELLNRLKSEIPRTWEGEPVDALTFHTAFEYFKAVKPRVFFVSLGETDEWGHAGRYDEYLTAARRFDDYAKTLWETAQAMPEYRGKTTLILATDHGRGCGPVEWKKHGHEIAGAEDIWLAFLGPDTPALGERANVPRVTLSQAAATLASLLGEDYGSAVPQAGKPISDAISP